MAIDLRRLRYFQAIASTGSFSAAARSLNVAQPALSYHISELEQDLDTALLIRSNKGVELTPAGKILGRHASDILMRVTEAEHEVRTQIRIPHGTVNVALAVTLARHIVPPLIRTVDERFPQVRVKVVDVGSVIAAEQVHAERVELALVPNAADIEDVEAQSLYREPLYLIERSERERPSRRPIRFRDIGDRPLVLTSRRYNLRQRVDEAAIMTGHQLNVPYEQESVDITRALVLEGLAGTITQCAVFDPETERPRLSIRKIVDPEIIRTHSLVRRKDRAHSLAHMAVSEVISDVIRDLVEDGTLPGELHS